MDGSKKLNQFMIDTRIPRAWRGRVPLVCTAGQGMDTPGQVIWLAGYRLDERFKVDAATKKILRLEFQPE
jgi:tRNA(Ile)-lysidine synthase